MLAAPTAPAAFPPHLLDELAVEEAGAARVEHHSRAGVPHQGERTFVRLRVTPEYDVWLICWGPGSSAPWHDHGGAAGAFCVVAGALVESLPNPAGGRLLRHTLRAFDHRAMSSQHLHEVSNESDSAAISVHVYSPPLHEMRRYAVDDESTVSLLT